MHKHLKLWGITLSLLAFIVTLHAQSYVNVQSYGANGDGITDDTSAIQSALNTGNTIYFPKTASYYKVTGSLSYSGHKIISNGAIIKADDVDFDILTVQNTHGIYIGDLSIEYPAEQTTLNLAKDPLTISNCTDIVIERVFLKNGGSLLLTECYDGIIRESQIINSAYMAFFISKSEYIILENCYSEKSMSAFRTEQSENIIIRNNTAEDSSMGIRIEDSTTVMVKDNLLRYCLDGVIIYGPCSGYAYPTTDITIQGNTLYHCYKAITPNKDEPYANTACGFSMATKMFVEDSLFLNNIVIGNDESTLLTDLSSNVVFNTAVLTTGEVRTDTTGTSYYTTVPYANYAYVYKSDGQMPVDWLFYINFPSGVDISNEDVLTMDTYWGGNTMWENDVMAFKLYSDVDRSNLICEIPLYMPYKESPMSAILWVPDGVNVSSVKCLEILRKKSDPTVGTICISDIRKGLKAKVGYLHSFLGDDAFNITLDSNAFIDHTYDWVNRKRYTSPDPTVITGSGITGTTAQRPASPCLDWRYYDTDLENPVSWNGSNWLDVNTFWMSEKVNEAIKFNASSYINLGDDDRMDIDEYTIEGWVKATSTSGRLIYQGDYYSSHRGYLIQFYNNQVYGYQSVGGNFYAVAVNSTNYPADGNYHHVALTFSYNGTTSIAKIYVDGTLCETRSATGSPDYPGTTDIIKMGENFNGYLRNWNFHPRVLSQSELTGICDNFNNRLYAYWRFNEANGDAEIKDYSVFGTVGTTSINVGSFSSMDEDTCRVAGRVGNGIEFDATGYVDLGNNSDLNVNNYTICAWILPTSQYVAARHIIERGSTSTPNGYLMQLYSDNRLYGYQSVGGNFYAVLVRYAFPHDSEFHHVAQAFSYDGTTSTLKLYIDGVLVDTASVTGAPDLPSTGIKCGSGFVGTIDEVKFFTRTLSSDEIEKEYLSIPDGNYL